MRGARRTGLALIVVVGVLGILSVLAVAFVTMAQLERKAARQRVLAEKAYLLARSGVEDALARTQLGQDVTYGGENWDGSSDGKLSAFEAAQEVYHPTGAGTPADIDSCPVRDAMRPSFYAKALPSSNPALQAVDGKQRGYSGMLSGDFSGRGNHYALKVSNGGFYVNGGDPTQPTAPGSPPTIPANYNDVLKRILGTLADAIDHDQGVGDGKPVGQADGWALIDQRPSTGWQSFDQIRDVALGGNQAKMDALAPYLTLRAWVDKHVIAPNAKPTMANNQTYHSWGDFKLDHAVTHNSCAPDFEKINGNIVGRAPVSLAWARKHRPAMIALIAGLKGIYIDQSKGTPIDTTVKQTLLTEPVPPADLIGVGWAAELKLDWSKPTDDCRTAVSDIMSTTSDLSTWQDWNVYCDTLPMSAGTPGVDAPPQFHAVGGGLVLTGTSDYEQAKRDLLKANFNPNTDLNKFNPNPTLWKLVDKSDLLVYSTEFSLCPTQGAQVSCVGRVLGPQGKLLAARTLTTTVGAPSVVRISTQKEFVCDNLGDLNVPGDETNLRHLGATPFINQSQGSELTWGHTLPGAKPQGLALQSYPEPYVNTQTWFGMSINPADYDGNLQLATLETPTNDYYKVNLITPPRPLLDMKMLASFTVGLDLDVADAAPANPNGNRIQTDVSEVGTSELCLSLLASPKLNTLYPDGAYSEKDRTPAYFDKNNANGLHGVASFWFKPNFHGDSQSTYVMRGHELVRWTNLVTGVATGTSPDQFFFLGYYTDYAVLAFEIGHSTNDTNLEHRFVTPARPDPAHTWQLMTYLWDFQQTNTHNTGDLRINAGMFGSPDDASFDQYGLGADPTGATDITEADMNGAHLIDLGRRGFLESGVAWKMASGADATLDEFAIYDFGSDPSKENPPVLAQNRYAEGRYYKGAAYQAPGEIYPVSDAAGSYFTAPITLPPGSMIQKVCWTWYRPKALPDDYAEIEMVTPGGDQYLWQASEPPPGGAMSRSTKGIGWTRDRQDWDLHRMVPGNFRMRVVFERETPVDSNTPILDSPVLDDLTVIYSPPAGGSILTWEDGEG